VNQHAVASLRPPHLKAMIAIGTDTDLYEEVIYPGGILNEEFFPQLVQERNRARDLRRRRREGLSGDG